MSKGPLEPASCTSQAANPSATSATPNVNLLAGAEHRGVVLDRVEDGGERDEHGAKARGRGGAE